MDNTIRLFCTEDARLLSQMICRTLREVNGVNYPSEEIEALSALYSPAYLREVAREGHLYVAKHGEEPIGCGAVTPHRNRPGNAYVMAVFTHPRYLGRGVGRAVMAAIEADPIFQEACRVELHASLTAGAFYEKLGYAHISVPPVLQGGCYYMEKK